MRCIALAIAILVAGCGSQPAERVEPEQPPPVTFDGASVTKASAQVAHGDRLVSVLGCRGCHTQSLQGQRFYELYASNLTRDIRKYTDAQLERLMREGVHPSGRDIWGMPSELFQHLSPADYKAVVAYLRTLEPGGEPTGKPLPFEPETRKLIGEGKLKPAAAFVRETKPIGPVDLGPTHELGRYVTMATCAECHGTRLEGGDGTPDLIVVGAYSREEFEKLITRGDAPGGRKLKNELMAMVAQNRFSRLTQNERDAVYAYLKARAERGQ